MARRPLLRTSLLRTLVLCSSLAGLPIACRSSKSFDELPPRELPTATSTTDEDIFAALAERSRSPATLWALLQMAIESPEQDGVFDAAILWKAPDAAATGDSALGTGRLRMSAFRDTLVSTHSIFDLAVGGTGYELILEGLDDGASPEGGTDWYSGPLEDPPELHPAFDIFLRLRERLFLPGRGATAENSRVERSIDEIAVAFAESANRLRVRWRLDPVSLAVRGASVLWGDREQPVEIEFKAYTQQGEHWLPSRFTLRDATKELLLDGSLIDVQLDLPLVEEDFDIDPEVDVP